MSSSEDPSGLPASRAEAIALGASKYFTGKPCKHGHVAIRNTAGQCIECSKATSREYQRSPQGQIYARMYSASKVYGLSASEFYSLWDGQGRACAICKAPLELLETQVDHNHATGDVRAILCKPCNLGLGHFRDDPKLLRKAAEYLERKPTRERLSPGRDWLHL